MSRVGPLIVVSVEQEPVPEVLSESEVAVVRGVLLGQSNKEIAAQRGTSPKTISNQLGSIYRKLGVASRDALAAKLVGEAAYRRGESTPVDLEDAMRELESKPRRRDRS